MQFALGTPDPSDDKAQAAPVSISLISCNWFIWISNIHQNKYGRTDVICHILRNWLRPGKIWFNTYHGLQIYLSMKSSIKFIYLFIAFYFTIDTEVRSGDSNLTLSSPLISLIEHRKLVITRIAMLLKNTPTQLCKLMNQSLSPKIFVLYLQLWLLNKDANNKK